MSLPFDRTSFTQEELSLPRRLALALVNPRRSLEALVGRETARDWLVPVLAACAVGLLAHLVTVHLVTDLEAPAVQQALQEMDEAQREHYLQGMKMLRAHGWIMVPLGVFSSLVLVGVVLLFVARSVLRTEVSFRQMLVVKGYASLVLIPEWLVRTPMMLLSRDPNIRTGPALFLRPEAEPDVFGRALANMDFFDLWQVWVMAVGVAVFGQTSARKAGAALVFLWLAWLVGGAILESIQAAAPPLPPATG